MAIRSLLFLPAVCFFSLASILAEAEPPFFHEQNRSLQSYASGAGYQSSDAGFTFASLDVSENYDVKGEYEFSSVSIFEQRFEDLGGGGYRETYRSLSCPVEKHTLHLTPLWIEYEDSLDTTSPDCIQYGYGCTYDPSTGYICEPHGYDGVVEVFGYWDYASVRSSDTVHRRGHDIWGGQWVTHCKASSADGMRVGGFAINDLYVPFTGYSGSSWSHYMTYNCNRNNQY